MARLALFELIVGIYSKIALNGFASAIVGGQVVLLPKFFR